MLKVKLRNGTVVPAENREDMYGYQSYSFTP
jgi:hypothetical protein